MKMGSGQAKGVEGGTLVGGRDVEVARIRGPGGVDWPGPGLGWGAPDGN